jgi:hypothetical protein
MADVIAFHPMKRFVYVADYFDEEREIPWNFVERTGNGRFAVIAS